MDLLLLLKTIVMGIVEGLTEFLPVSSTGHLIAADALLNFSASIGGKDVAATFEIFIQLGAILAVVVFFVRDLADLLRRAVREPAARQVLVNVAAAFVPAAAIGFLAKDFIKGVLFGTPTVGVALIFGGIVMLWVEGRDHRGDTTDVERMSLRQALTIGAAQILALVPGMSRSATTLIGGLFAGLDRPTALRFSFYLSIPTLGIATIYDFIKSRDVISSAALPMFGVGAAVAFVVALVVVKFFLAWVSRRDLKPFGWYRIVAGLALLAATAAGYLS
jgi:undecaprenyl-diphosphatase